MPSVLLLVEDEPGLRKLLEMALRRAGFDVIGCANGAEGLAALAEKNSITHAVVDLSLPDMHGQEVIAAIEKLNPNTLIVATSGLTPSDPNSLGNARLLLKPFMPPQLLEALGTSA
jgi:DNA-binding response OmpR family regulator